MASQSFSKLQFLLLASLLLVTLFESTSGCSRVHRPKYHHRHHQTTTESYSRKRSVDNDNVFLLNSSPIHHKIHHKRSVDNNEVGNFEYRFPECGQTFCPKIKYYPTDAIVEAVDRLHQYLYADEAHKKDFADRGMNHELFFTSERSRTLYRRPNDHWYLSNPSGCKVHASVIFPQEGYSSVDRDSYYVVNVPNLRQGLIQYNCKKENQVCAKDEIAGMQSTKTCQQNYSLQQLVVLPSTKSHFDIRDFKLATFYVPESCMCASAREADSENMIY